jgi:hypothetical protein
MPYSSLPNQEIKIGVISNTDSICTILSNHPVKVFFMIIFLILIATIETRYYKTVDHFMTM